MAKAWFPFYLNDYAADTVLLSLEEHGAYILLMSFYWNEEGEVYASAGAIAYELHKVCRCTTDAECYAVDHVINKYFTVVDGKYVNHRLDKELAKSASISASRVKAAKAKHAKGSASAGASAEQVHTQSQSQSQSHKDLLKTLSDSFEKLWSEYPNKTGKKEALRHFNASVKTVEDLQKIWKAINNYMNHLLQPQNSFKQFQNGSTWFNNWRDWVDWVEPEARVETAAVKSDPMMDRVRKLQGGQTDGLVEDTTGSRVISVTDGTPTLLPE
jgi:uncharacterized protein YdaU (DUF1376 family)